jgi:hypothetical protein
MAGDVESSGGESRPLWSHVRRLFLTRFRVLATVVVDGLFLVGVTVVNVLVSRVLADLHLGGTDEIVATTLQWMIIFATLGVTLAFLVRDLVSSFARGLSGDDE